MKNLVYVLGLSLALIFAACSDTDQNSPVAPSLEKRSDDISSLPYKLNQTFAELNTASVDWYNEKDGLVIVVSDRSEIVTNKILFATIEYVNDKGATMAFLGDSRNGKYFLNGISEKEISSINIFYYDQSISSDTRNPYSSGQIFDGLVVKGWVDGGAYAKVATYPIPANTDHMFAQIIASEANQLIFIGRPDSDSFDFQKSEKLNLKDIKIFTHQK